MIFPHLFTRKESDNKIYKRLYLRNRFLKKRCVCKITVKTGQVTSFTSDTTQKKNRLFHLMLHSGYVPVYWSLLPAGYIPKAY